jgi:hypothetical protein
LLLYYIVCALLDEIRQSNGIWVETEKKAKRHKHKQQQKERRKPSGPSQFINVHRSVGSSINPQAQSTLQQLHIASAQHPNQGSHSLIVLALFLLISIL